MSGIAGVARAGQTGLVNQMLDKMLHRGRDWRETLESQGTTFGVIGSKAQNSDRAELRSRNLVRDRVSQAHFAQAQVCPGTFILTRDALGVRPLYYGWTSEGTFCFASEMKGLLVATRDIHEMPHGQSFDGKQANKHTEIIVQLPGEGAPESFAVELRSRLEKAVQKRVGDGNVGVWLSGGLDSSTMAALARPNVDRLHTFAAGMPGAPDLQFAQIVAEFIDSDHHECIVQQDEIFSTLPDTIYALGSFDALLVRSSVMNYLVAKAASQFVPAVFSGEGGDELFAGYEYLKTLDPADLSSELVDITNRLHNTALQRVDRCSSAFGIVAHVGFLDPDVVEYALKIPASLKLRNGVEKWVLREAMKGSLPDAVLQRPKAKFWEGAGVKDFLAQYAEQRISNVEFKRERELPNGSRLNTKEELYYYRIFREHFGEFDDLSWMGRTKGSPVA
ncbi:MAG TPA: asparagine synthase-related protein [Anaerolineales bacterium]|nr:asparagine synthase-related protein [Anaerolineales bacterium]